jgi:uncharacterized protein YhbP (UPF0306 family)
VKPQEVVKQYLPQINIMQLATVADGNPYLCTVHYYSDDDFNLYWASMLSRRHSKEIEQNPQVAAYVLVHENTPEEDYVVGITFIGKAKLVGAKVNPAITEAYAKKLGDSPDFVRKVAEDTTPFKFYEFRTEKVVLFDNKNFPDDPRQEFIS